MTGAGNQIFDLMLGNAGVADTASSGGQPVEPVDTLFGDVFSKALAMNAVLGGGSAEGTIVGNDGLAGDFLQVRMGLTGRQPADIIGPATGEPADNLSNLLNSVGDGVSEAGSGRNVLAALPLNGPISNQSLRDIINSVATDLEPGKYLITDAFVKNGSLNITVTSDAKDPQSIRISLPLAVLQENLAAASGRMTPANRVELNNVNSQLPQLESYFSDLKLRELTVEADRPQHGSSTGKHVPITDEPLIITLTAERGGQELAIRSKLNRQQVRASTANSATATDAVSEEQPFLETSAKEHESPTGQNPFARRGKAAVGFDATQTGKPKPGGFEPLSQFGRQLNSIENPSGLTGFDRSEAVLDASADKFNARPVRVSLPESFQAASRQHGQSIMLKIEPEHLGPARLNLVMRHDALVARVVVDSVQAKVLIERNLDTLVEQLAKADINLEKIEVEVGGSGGEGGQFERRMFWPQRNRAAVLTHDNETNAERAIVTPDVYQAPRTYVGESGVNLLA